MLHHAARFWIRFKQKLLSTEMSTYQERNLLFKLVNASILFLEFQVPRWSAGPVKTVYIDLKDDSGYSVLNRMVEFHFKSHHA